MKAETASPGDRHFERGLTPEVSRVRFFRNLREITGKEAFLRRLLLALIIGFATAVEPAAASDQVLAASTLEAQSAAGDLSRELRRPTSGAELLQVLTATRPVSRRYGLERQALGVTRSSPERSSPSARFGGWVPPTRLLGGDAVPPLCESLLYYAIAPPLCR